MNYFKLKRYEIMRAMEKADTGEHKQDMFRNVFSFEDDFQVWQDDTYTIIQNGNGVGVAKRNPNYDQFNADRGVTIAAFRLLRFRMYGDMEANNG